MTTLAAAVLLALLAPRARAADAEDAVAARDAGRLEDARALWSRVASTGGADGFAWAQYAWAELAVGRGAEARSSFARAVDRAPSTAVAGEASLGLGLSLMLDGKTKDAVEPLRRAGLASPYAIAPAARLRAEAALAAGDKDSALAYLRQALEVDSFDRESLRRLMTTLERVGSSTDAWRAAARAVRMDPQDEEAARVLERTARKVKGDRDYALGLRRMTRPVLDPESSEPALPVSTRTIRVGLFGASDGRPTLLTSCVVVPNAAFRVTPSSGDAPRAAGAAGDPRRLEFDPETRELQVRDLARNLLFATREPLRLTPDSARGSVLVASAAFSAAEPDLDRGDRELRGAIEAFPGDKGFTLVSEAPLEQYLYGVVSLAMPDGSPPEALAAEAVVARTAALDAAARRADARERFDVVDSGVLRTIGVSGELRGPAAAVARTDGAVLTSSGAAIAAPQSEDSGGWTEDGVADGAFSGEPPRSGLALEKFLRDPPSGLYSAAAPGATAAPSRWMLALDARDLRERAARRRDVGRLKSVRVSARTPGGRASELEVVGEKGTLVYTGFEGIESFLSPGSLRSAYLSLQPIDDGRWLRELVVWGAGTGPGAGFSRAGAVGQAKSGADWRAIVLHYFPRAELSGAQDAPKK